MSTLATALVGVICRSACLRASFPDAAESKGRQGDVTERGGSGAEGSYVVRLAKSTAV